MVQLPEVTASGTSLPLLPRSSLDQKVIRMKQISQESGWVPWCLPLVVYSLVLLERVCAGVGSVVPIHPSLLQEPLKLWAEVDRVDRL